MMWAEEVMRGRGRGTTEMAPNSFAALVRKVQLHFLEIYSHPPSTLPLGLSLLWVDHCLLVTMVRYLFYIRTFLCGILLHIGLPQSGESMWQCFLTQQNIREKVNSVAFEWEQHWQNNRLGKTKQSHKTEKSHLYWVTFACKKQKTL